MILIGLASIDCARLMHILSDAVGDQYLAWVRGRGQPGSSSVFTCHVYKSYIMSILGALQNVLHSYSLYKLNSDKDI